MPGPGSGGPEAGNHFISILPPPPLPSPPAPLSSPPPPPLPPPPLPSPPPSSELIDFPVSGNKPQARPPYQPTCLNYWL